MSRREKTPPCSRGCGQRVWFNWNAKPGEPGKTDSGKLRPLQVSAEGEMLNQVHDCPNSTWNRMGGQQSTQPTSTAATTTSSSSTISPEAITALMVRLEKLNTDLERFYTMLLQANEAAIERLDKLIADVKRSNENMAASLDDDGDGNREEGDYPEP